MYCLGALEAGAPGGVKLAPTTRGVESYGGLALPPWGVRVTPSKPRSSKARSYSRTMGVAAGK